MATELYLFQQSGTYVGFTPTMFSVTQSGITYTPAIIKRSGIKLTENFAKSPITITFDALNSFALGLLQNVPEVPVILTIYKSGVTYWMGQVLEVNRKSITTIEISCDSNYSVTVKKNQRYRVSLHCNHTLYSSQCGVLQSSWGISGGIITASSNILTIPSLTQANGYFNMGMATLNGQTRSIIESVGTKVTLTSPFTGVLTGNVVLYPGCALTEDACSAFGNTVNGLMFPRMPTQNPFGSQGLM